ncbi:Putative niacin/nicotinamide transporter NaiP [bacterium HR28]|jgi:putative MFS transporter|uniref:MFS transporter n=1 Tax=Thermomicrobium roseum TaxID=500 RepID=A0A7C2ATX5_THERO|nr:Putative niacin/nicotinamide transporter NaiP [bacterium HR28]
MLTLSQRLDELPLSREHWRIVLLSGLGWMFDAMDVGLVAFVLVSLGRDWELSRPQLGLVASAGFLGMFLGALLAGRLADRYGRRTIFLANLLLYSFGTLLSALSWNFSSLLLFRFLTGIGLGGELPVAAALVSEFAPARHRGRLLVILESFWAYGWILAAIIGLLVVPQLPSWGWRVAFLIGALPALSAAYLRRRLPESPRYLDIVGRHEEALAVLREFERAAGVAPAPVATTPVPQRPSFLEQFGLLWSRQLLRRTLMLWILWFGIVFAYYGVFTWLPSLLVERGLTVARSFSYVFITTLAQIPGYFSAAYLVDRWGRKPTLVAYLLGSALASWLLGNAGTAPILVLWGCLLSFFNLGAWGVVYTYTPELYPTTLRGFGSGAAASFGRIAGIIAPYLTPWLLSSGGLSQPAVFALFMAVFFVIAGNVLLLGEETRGRPLEHLTPAAAPTRT